MESGKPFYFKIIIKMYAVLTWIYFWERNNFDKICNTDMRHKSDINYYIDDIITT